jgi:hypothetical protein
MTVAQFTAGAIMGFLFATASSPTLGLTQLPKAPTVLSPEVKRPGCEADYSPQSRAKVKNE